MGLIIGYLLGAILLGLFLQLNYDLEFYGECMLDQFGVDEFLFWIMVLMWPVTIPIYAIIILGYEGYNKLLGTIENIMEKRSQDDNSENEKREG